MGDGGSARRGGLGRLEDVGAWVGNVGRGCVWGEGDVSSRGRWEICVG